MRSPLPLRVGTTLPEGKPLLEAVSRAKEPAFYLQARWDYDARPTVDLAHDHYYGGADDAHGKPFMAAVYSYPKPCLDRNCTVLDYQKVHTGFAHDAELWGPAVLHFLQHNGVK